MEKPQVTLKYGTGAKCTGEKVSLTGHALTATSVFKMPEVKGHNSKLKLVCTDETFSQGIGKMTGANMTLELPGKASVAMNLQTKVLSGDVQTKTTFLDKPMTMKLAHTQKGPKTTLDSTWSVLDNTKLNAKYCFNDNAVNLKATHVEGLFTYEPSYDVANKSWSVSTTRKMGKDTLKGTFGSNKKATLEYNHKPLKVTLAAPIGDLKQVTCSFTCEKAL